MTRDWISLQDHPIEIAEAVAFAMASEAGGIDLFVGTTRAEVSREGFRLLALDYEAYEDMAIKQLQTLAQSAGDRWPVLKLVILHRTGRVAVCEPSVVVAVATPHRADAFEATRWLIDSLKSQAAIWKKEIWSDGSGTWVHPQTV